MPFVESGIYTPTEIRRQQARSLAEIVRAAGEVELDMDFTPEFETDIRFDNPYGRLSEDIFVNFNRLAKATEDKKLVGLASNPNGLHGLYVMTRLMSYAPAAYVAHKTAANEKDTATVEELSEVMARSSGLLDTFTHCDIKTNYQAEVDFGLVQFEPVYETTPFIVGLQDGSQELALQASPRTLLQSKINIARRKLVGELAMDSKGRCPAVGMVMEFLWKDGVKECVTRPELFPTGLQAALAQ